MGFSLIQAPTLGVHGQGPYPGPVDLKQRIPSNPRRRRSNRVRSNEEVRVKDGEGRNRFPEGGNGGKTGTL